MPAEAPKELEVHRKNLYNIANKIVNTREFEQPTFKVRFPVEAAALESMTYWQTEEMMVKADGNVWTIGVYLGQAKAAQAYLERTLKMKEKLLMGDPELQKDAKNETQRAFNMANNTEYSSLIADLRTADMVVAYMDRLYAACDSNLQVVKKIRDAANTRFERDQAWERAQSHPRS